MTGLSIATHAARADQEAAEQHILIIDDEVDILKALQRQFRRHYKVHLANGAAEGYAIMAQVPIQVII